MKSFLALCLFASVLKARADVNVGVATVMCNCAAQVDTYNAFNSAVADCSAYNGAGAGSCVANVLGHLSAADVVWILEVFQLCMVTLPVNVAPLVLLKLPTLLPLMLG